MISFVTGLMMYRMATMEEWQETTLTIIPWIQPLLWIISVNTGFPTNPITIYRYTGERDLGEKKKDTTKFQKVFINGYSDLGSTNDGNAAKEAIYEALSLRGPLLGTIDLSLSFSEYRGDHVLRPENIESGSEFNPGSDDPSNDDSLDKNNSSSSNNKSGSQDSGFQDSGSKDSRSQDSGSHDSGSHDSGTHYSGSHDSGSHDSSSHASDDAGNICHAIVIVGMDYDENYFLVLNSQGLDWGVDGVGKVDCSLIFDILEPHVNDDRNRGMKGPALSALAYSPKQQRELKHLGKGMPEKCLASGPDIPALLGTVDAEDEKNPFEHVTQSPKSLRVPGSVREPINPAWRCFHNVIGDLRCPISDTRCQTETGGFMMEHLQLLTRSTGHLDFPRLEVKKIERLQKLCLSILNQFMSYLLLPLTTYGIHQLMLSEEVANP